MDGIFMKKCIKQIAFCMTLVFFAWFGSLLADRQQLHDGLIRLHVVANSDSAEDQNVKLMVRDAVLSSIQDAIAEVSDQKAAKDYLKRNLKKIEQIANETLAHAGFQETAIATFCEEAFDTRIYDTFTLPAGIYESLRIVIGKGNGQNWWCVVFPTLCIPATTDGFAAVAADSGLSPSLNHALRGNEGHSLRFYFLDALGTLENMLFEE